MQMRRVRADECDVRTRVVGESGESERVTGTDSDGTWRKRGRSNVGNRGQKAQANPAGRSRGRPFRSVVAPGAGTAGRRIGRREERRRAERKRKREGGVAGRAVR